MELATDMELVVKLEAVTEFPTERLEAIATEFEKVAAPPIAALPRTSILFVMTEPFGAYIFPYVIMSPPTPKFPTEEIFPRT
jgi:hypothetical protein